MECRDRSLFLSSCLRESKVFQGPDMPLKNPWWILQSSLMAVIGNTDQIIGNIFGFSVVTVALGSLCNAIHCQLGSLRNIFISHVLMKKKKIYIYNEVILPIAAFYLLDIYYQNVFRNETELLPSPQGQKVYDNLYLEKRNWVLM